MSAQQGATNADVALELAAFDPTGSVPLSVRSAVNGLIVGTHQAQYRITELRTVPGSLTLPLDAVVQKVKSFEISIKMLQILLRHIDLGTLEISNRIGLVDIDILIVILTACVMTFSELEGKLDDLTTNAEELGVSTAEKGL